MGRGGGWCTSPLASGTVHKDLSVCQPPNDLSKYPGCKVPAGEQERIKCRQWFRVEWTAALHSTPQWRRLRIYAYRFSNAERGSVAPAMPHIRTRPAPFFCRCLSACSPHGTAALFSQECSCLYRGWNGCSKIPWRAVRQPTRTGRSPVKLYDNYLRHIGQTHRMMKF